MYFLRAILILSICCLLSQSEAKGKLQIHPYFAAKCLALSKRCNWFYERYSGEACKRDTSFYRQPKECLEKACPWCSEWPKRSLRYPCGHRRVMKACKISGPGMRGTSPTGPPTPSSSSSVEPSPSASTSSVPSMTSSSTPSPSTTPSIISLPSASTSPVPSMSSSSTPSPSTTPSMSASISPVPSPSMSSEPEEMMSENKKKPKKDCVWIGEDDKIVINLGVVPLTEGWDRVERDGYKGIEFNRSPVKGPITPRGMYGKMCFKVKPPMSGNYYFTAISYAPHNTEHNDVWVENEKGFELWQHGKKDSYVHPGTWLKAYQNTGRKGMSEHFKTIDHDGHRFIIPNVVSGKIFTVCISGRSLQYEMYQLILMKCEGMYCKGGIMNDLFDKKPSKCM